MAQRWIEKLIQRIATSHYRSKAGGEVELILGAFQRFSFQDFSFTKIPLSKEVEAMSLPSFLNRFYEETF